jgi:hypothetical protein
MEIWKDIKGYEGHYQVSNLGNVRSLKYNRVKLIRQFKSGGNNPYMSVSLCVDSKQKSYMVHKLVASTFLNHKSQGQNVNGNTIIIDHINGDKNDNRLLNLRELSHRENVSGNTPGVYKTKYGKYQVRIQHNKKRINIATVDSISEANKLYIEAKLKLEKNN